MIFQEVIEHTLFPHGLSDSLHPLQGDPAEGRVSGGGLPPSSLLLFLPLPISGLCLSLSPPPSLLYLDLSVALPHTCPLFVSISPSLCLDFFPAFSPFIFFFSFPLVLKLLLNVCSEI